MDSDCNCDDCADTVPATGSGAFSRKFEYLEGAIPAMYDAAGKILSSPTKNLVERISYSDGDELAYTYDGKSISYDALGNPTSYLGSTLT